MRHLIALCSSVAFVSVVALSGCGQVADDPRVESQSQAVTGGLSCSPASSRSGPRRDLRFTIEESWVAFAPGMTYEQGLLVCPGVDNVPFVPFPGVVPTTCTGRTKNLGFEIFGIQATSASPYGTGVTNTSVNRNLDASGAGRMSGTFHLELANGVGSWDGIFEGTRTVGTHCPPDVPCWEDDLTLVGCGTSGEVQGMRFRATSHFDELFTSFTAVFDVHASDP